MERHLPRVKISVHTVCLIGVIRRSCSIGAAWCALQLVKGAARRLVNDCASPVLLLVQAPSELRLVQILCADARWRHGFEPRPVSLLLIGLIGLDGDKIHHGRAETAGGDVGGERHGCSRTSPTPRCCARAGCPRRISTCACWRRGRCSSAGSRKARAWDGRSTGRRPARWRSSYQPNRRRYRHECNADGYRIP